MAKLVVPPSRFFRLQFIFQSIAFEHPNWRTGTLPLGRPGLRQYTLQTKSLKLYAEVVLQIFKV